MNCRHCGAKLSLPFLDLGTAPPSNAYLTEADLHASERWYPLRLLVCEHCWLVQTEDYAQAEELFSADYAYFSAYSSTWLDHARRYVAQIVERFQLGSQSRVVEVAANDGYLLQYVQAAGIPCYGIEPTASTAQAARAKGLEVIERFFGCALAEELAQAGRQADVMVANNVLAHVPDINDFVAGFARLLKPQGIATFEFPHLLRMVQGCQFDTAYHEHYSYLSLTTVVRIFASQGLSVFDVEELPTHGGSLRVYAQRSDSGAQPVRPSVESLLDAERAAGIRTADFYRGFQAQANRIKRELLKFLIGCAEAGQTVVGYGAAAKGNTLLNFAGVRSDLLPFVVDKNPAKQGKYLPGSRIPIRPPEAMLALRPDYVLILPWNIRAEIRAEYAGLEQQGSRFVVAVPQWSVL